MQNSAYYSWVDSPLPAFRGAMDGKSTGGVFAGHAGAYQLSFQRGPEWEGGPGEGTLGYPYALRREERWVRWMRPIETITCQGSVLWLTDFKSEPTRLELTLTSSDQFLLQDNHGGSGWGRFQATDLIHDPKRGIEMDFVQR
jgi:hypothetical protein